MAINEEKYEEALRLYRETNLKRTDICKMLGLNYLTFSYFLKSRYPELLSNHKKQNSCKTPQKEIEKKYKSALQLYSSTDLTIKAIAEKTGVTPKGLGKYIQTYHRDLMLKRYGINTSKRNAQNIKISETSRGQRINSRYKYSDAIEACDSLDFITLNVSEIARWFNVDPVGLLNQLRVHYPEITIRRERRRRELGIADNKQRGARQSSVSAYELAVKMLNDSNKTIEEVANECDVSFSGLQRYILEYNKELSKKRERERKAAIGNKEEGTLNGKGSITGLNKKYEDKYKIAVELFKTSDMGFTEIANQTNVSLSGLKHHLKRWYPDLVKKRKNTIQ